MSNNYVESDHRHNGFLWIFGYKVIQNINTENATNRHTSADLLVTFCAIF